MGSGPGGDTELAGATVDDGVVDPAPVVGTAGGNTELPGEVVPGDVVPGDVVPVGEVVPGAGVVVAGTVVAGVVVAGVVVAGVVDAGTVVAGVVVAGTVVPGTVGGDTELLGLVVAGAVVVVVQPVVEGTALVGGTPERQSSPHTCEPSDQFTPSGYTSATGGTMSPQFTPRVPAPAYQIGPPCKLPGPELSPDNERTDTSARS